MFIIFYLIWVITVLLTVSNEFSLQNILKWLSELEPDLTDQKMDITNQIDALEQTKIVTILVCLGIYHKKPKNIASIRRLKHLISASNSKGQLDKIKALIEKINKKNI